MMTNNQDFGFLNEVDPRVEAEKQIWSALKTLGITGDRAELVRVAMGTTEPEKIRAALEAMMHPSAFAERDFAL